MIHCSTRKPILLIGANIRFLAENAVRHGHNVSTIDYYGDTDTQKLCPNKSSLRDGDGQFSLMSLVDLARGVDNCAVVFGPGFENDSEARSNLKKIGPVFGCDDESIRMVRNPDELSKAAASWDFGYPGHRTTRPEPTGAVRWLVKPLAGMGGEGVHFLDDMGSDIPNVYYQEFVEGLPSSAAVVSNGSDAAVLGVMTQIVGDKSFGASGFRFVGNVFPHPFSDEIHKDVTAIAESLTLEFSLRGLWSFDFIYHQQLSLVEVNPRLSAGMGLLGVVTMNDLLGMHMDGVTRTKSSLIIDPGSSDGYHAHARVFAEKDGVFSGAKLWKERGARDIPHDGDVIVAGSPILTISEFGLSYREVMSRLKDKAKTVQTSLCEKKTLVSI